jgi:hypothetical protein
VPDSLGKPVAVPGSRVAAREASLADEATTPVALSEADEATDPVALSEADEAPQRQDDTTPEPTGAAAGEEGGRSFPHRIGSRAVWLPLACVAALLVGFASMTVLLRLGDRPTRSDTKPVPTTAAPVAPSFAATPAVTTPPASTASGPAVENEPPLPAPGSAPPDSAPAAPDTTAPPNLNPSGKAPPGLNR